MKTLPNTNLTTKECEHIFYKRAIGYGGEATVCETDKPNTLYKIFHRGLFSDEIAYMSDNKFNKINRLYQMNLNHMVKPLGTLSMDGALIGYEMTRDLSHKKLADTDLTRRQTIEVLRQTKTILEYFDSKEITYSDVKENNILINPATHECVFCDIDNVRVGELPVDLMGVELRKYYFVYQHMDNRVQAYMHNLLTLQQLGYRYFYEDILTALNNKDDLPPNFQIEANSIFYGMSHPTEFNGEYVIQYLKR